MLAGVWSEVDRLCREEEHEQYLDVEKKISWR